MVQDSSAVPFTGTSTVLYTVQYIAREQMAIARALLAGDTTNFALFLTEHSWPLPEHW